MIYVKATFVAFIAVIAVGFTFAVSAPPSIDRALVLGILITLAAVCAYAAFLNE